MVRIGVGGLAVAAVLFSAPLWADEKDTQKTVETATRKAVLVTGASSGIGLKITEYLAERGFHVYAGARNDADIERLDSMDNVTSLRLDVTRQADIDAAVEFVSNQGRGLFGVVNNAGVASIGLLSTVPDDDVLWIHDVNVMGPLRINKAFLPLLMESNGRTVIIGSLSAYATSPSGGAYSMSKIALEAYAETLANELEETGVSVGIIDPGPYRSRGREKVAMQMLTGSPDLQQELTDEQKAVLAQVRQANDKLKEPDDVAEAVVRFLTSDSPRLRSMVSPDEQTADLSIRAALSRAVQLNADQPFELSRDELVALLDDVLETDCADTN